ncbi:UNVERIFIED_CONTAM: hypothetical protein Sradi_7057900 [Sesamum radiatum]|uniref:Uncharacterized protein n=1 Tax=Sesamum radiatum TaxID=300843 RepID=A0AAW2J7K5_SESRA
MQSSFHMRSDLQDPFRKGILASQTFPSKIQQYPPSSCPQAGVLATCKLAACHQARSRPGELAPSELVGWQPCRLAGCWSSRPASWLP